MPTLRSCYRIVSQVLVSVVEWLFWFVCYFYKPDYILRADQRREPEEHEDHGGKLHKTSTLSSSDPSNSATFFMHIFIALTTKGAVKYKIIHYIFLARLILANISIKIY